MSKGKKIATDKGVAERFSHLDDLHLGGIERDLKAGKYVEPEALVALLRKHGSRPIPPIVLDYVCRMLEGRVRQPPGIKAFPKIYKNELHMVIRVVYGRNLSWLQARKERYGHLEGWSRIKGADFWKGTPGERAARMAAHRYYRGVNSWRAVQNIAGSRK